MQNSEIIYGKNPVDELLETNRKRINKIFIAKGIKYDEKIKRILNRARKYKINVQEVPRTKLDTISSGVHQGIAASVSPINYTDFKDLLKSIKDKRDALLIILDKVEDPHNLGSIIRSAAAAGADGIILPKRHSSPVTSVAEKASAGTAEKISISLVGNLSNVIDQLKENNFWIIGAEADGDKYYFEQDYDMNCAIVMGGEDQGISSLVRKKCDILTKIPMKRNVNSLNVANATSILIFEIIRQRLIKNN